MPTYEYRCAKCGDDLEVYQSFSEAPLKRHAGCGGKLDKVFGAVGIVLKGSGFYKTDNRESSKARSKAREESSSSTTASDSSSNSSDSGGSDSKKSSGDAAKPAASSEKSSDTKTPEKKSSDTKSGERSPVKSA